MREFSANPSLANSLTVFGPEVTGHKEAKCLITVLMPCLNESKTLEECINQAHAGCTKVLASSNVASATSNCISERDRSIASYEVLIADNGSTDGSQQIARECGARVIQVDKKGYGAALIAGIGASSGKYIVMGDSDCSYDFGEIPRFLLKLEEGYHLVLGNRFTGGIISGAMPWHHRYIGNPFLSKLGNLLYKTNCNDWHCGLRAFDRQRIIQTNLKTSGMEFASELVIKCSRAGLNMTEIPVKLYPDKRGRPPHLRSFRDGFRHLKVLLSYYNKR